MGRKSLLKSTKRKASAKQTKESTIGATKKEATVQNKAVVVKAASAAATAAVKPAPAKTDPKKIQAAITPTKKAVEKAVEKKDITGKSQKSEPAKKNIPTVKELLFKQFATSGDKTKPVQLKKQSVKIPDAPPFVTGYGEKETTRIRALLRKAFDLTTTQPSAGEVKAKETKGHATAAAAEKITLKKSAVDTQATEPKEKKKMTTKELLFKQFGKMDSQPKPVTVKKQAGKIPDAPAFVSGYGEKDTDRIRGLLFQQFDLSAVASASPKAAPKPEKSAGSMKDLLFKKFEGHPIKAVKIEKTYVKIPDAPAYLSGYGKEDSDKVRALLFRKFDLGATKPEVEKAAAPKAKQVAVSGRDLLFKRFEGAAAKPVKVARPSVTLPEAPPFISGLSKEETAKIHAVLFKQFKIVPEGKPTVTAPKPVAPSCEPSAAPDTCACMGKGKTLAVLVLAAVVALLIGVSYSNRGNYYLKEVNGVVQVWQGKFAPSGEEAILTLDGVTMPENVQPVYTKQEISPVVFDFMMGKADSLLDALRGPDFGAMKQCLQQALDFAPTPMFRTRLQNRLRSIDFVVLFHKADVAIGKGELRDLMAAKAYLGKAGNMASTTYQRDMVARAQTAVEEAIAGGKK